MEAQTKIFQSHIQLAMQNKIKWDVLISMTDELCSNKRKCAIVTNIILNKLKAKKDLPVIVVPDKHIRKVVNAESNVQTGMPENDEIKIFKSHVQLAMKKKIKWSILLSMKNELCSSYEKCLKVIQVLLDELKAFRNVPCIVAPQPQSLQATNVASAKDISIKSEPVEDDPLYMNFEPEMSEDMFEASDNLKLEPNPDEGSYSYSECLLSFQAKNCLQHHQELKHNLGIQKTESPSAKIKIEGHSKDFHTVDLKSVPGSSYHEGLLSIKDEEKVPFKEKTVKCGHCEKVMVKRSLQRHIKTAHKTSRKKISNKKKLIPGVSTKCSKCGKIFQSEEQMENHLSSTCNYFQNISGFQCEKCPAKFTTKQGLGTHVKRFHNYLIDQKCSISFSTSKSQRS